MKILGVIVLLFFSIVLALVISFVRGFLGLFRQAGQPSKQNMQEEEEEDTTENNKKLFTKDEGEYIDFEEVKEEE